MENEVWRTINGVHVLIDKDGNILKGPKSLQKSNIQKRLKEQIKNKKDNEYKEYYKKEHLGEPSNYQKGDEVEYTTDFLDTIKGTIVREATYEEKMYHINTNLKGYIVKDKHGYQQVVADIKIKLLSSKK